MNLTKHLKTKSDGHKIFVLIILVILVCVPVQSSDVIPPGEPGPWPLTTSPFCCEGGQVIRGMVQNEFVPSLDYPRLGYPLRGSLFKGLNDTSQIMILIGNRSDSSYSLSGKNPEKWFRPRVFQNQGSSHETYLLADSTVLGYRIRGWYDTRNIHWQKGQRPNLIPKLGFQYSMVLDVWELPEGTNCLCLDTAKVATPGFKKNLTSYIYEYRHAQSLADSVNAYEACFSRMMKDSNFTAAEFWIDKLMEVNPNSIPGFWLKSEYQLAVKDSAGAKLSLDKALTRLNANEDRALAGFNNTPMMPQEVEYREWLKEMITRHREWLGP